VLLATVAGGKMSILSIRIASALVVRFKLSVGALIAAVKRFGSKANSTKSWGAIGTGARCLSFGGRSTGPIGPMIFLFRPHFRFIFS
jgi:hypothetical protein